MVIFIQCGMVRHLFWCTLQSHPLKYGVEYTVNACTRPIASWYYKICRPPELTPMPQPVVGTWAHNMRGWVVSTFGRSKGKCM